MSESLFEQIARGIDHDEVRSAALSAHDTAFLAKVWVRDQLPERAFDIENPHHADLMFRFMDFLQHCQGLATEGRLPFGDLGTVNLESRLAARWARQFAEASEG